MDFTLLNAKVLRGNAKDLGKKNSPILFFFPPPRPFRGFVYGNMAANHQNELICTVTQGL